MPPSDEGVADGRFPDLVFGGGGTRCFWQGSFMSVVRPHIAPARRINAVSGGVLSALAYVTGQRDRLLGIMGTRFDALAAEYGNVSLARWRAGGGLMVYESTYRDVVAELMAAPGAVEAVAEGPEFSVQLARAGRLGVYATLLAYASEVPVRSTPHVGWSHRLGAEPHWVDARQAAREGRIVDLTVAAASSPPAFEGHVWDGIAVLDGGTVDNAPPHRDAQDQLILVTRPYRNLPDLRGRTYAKPSRKVPTNKLDFTDRAGIEATWALGIADGETFLSKHGLS